VYRFVFSPRWIGLGLLMALVATVMVGFGLWQLDRYHLRSGINDRIDSAAAAEPVPLDRILDPPGSAKVGPAPSADDAWMKVTVTGRYEKNNEILARARTVRDTVGFEVLTPLVLADGSAVIIDRGWIAPSDRGASVPPRVPPAPEGKVTVVGRIHAPESRSSPPEPFAGTLAVRRIAPDQLASVLPYSLYGAYITLESQTPPASAAFVPIPPDRQNAAMNAGYVLQWWLFAALTLFGFGYLVVRQARSRGTDHAPLDVLPLVSDPARENGRNASKTGGGP
jgi:cytochrome oxidase assembly protein ShyY1